MVTMGLLIFVGLPCTLAIIDRPYFSIAGGNVPAGNLRGLSLYIIGYS